jgi:hypothetical protein
MAKVQPKPVFMVVSAKLPHLQPRVIVLPLDPATGAEFHQNWSCAPSKNRTSQKLIESM